MPIPKSKSNPLSPATPFATPQYQQRSASPAGSDRSDNSNHGNHGGSISGRASPSLSQKSIDLVKAAYTTQEHQYPARNIALYGNALIQAILAVGGATLATNYTAAERDFSNLSHLSSTDPGAYQKQYAMLADVRTISLLGGALLMGIHFASNKVARRYS